MAPNKSETASIADLYTRGIEEVKRIIAGGNKKERTVALKTLDDLTAMRLKLIQDETKGRTAHLTGLIAELTRITASIRPQGPCVDALKAITTILGNAGTLLAAEKKNLLPPST